MRLIIPHAYNVKGGVERVTVSLVREFSGLIDRVIFVLPADAMEYFKGLLPPSEKLIYEPLNWPGDLISKIKKRLCGSRLEYLIKKHKATHCLYPIINGQKVPDITIPVFGILYDLYWRFLEHISDDRKLKREKELREWAQRSASVFTISETTRKEAISRLSAYAHRFKAVPLAIDMPNELFQNSAITGSGKVVFYYPSAHFSRQKNQITLLKAAITLSAKSLQFKIIVSGEDIERIAGEDHFDRPWQEECRVFFHDNMNILSKHIELSGFCSHEKVESFYSEASCVILPSTYEGFGLPLAEALARGMPVICTDLNVFHEQVDLYKCSDRVEFFPKEDAAALAKKMEEFLKSPKAQLSAEDVKNRFLHWTWKDVAKAYVDNMERRT